MILLHFISFYFNVMTSLFTADAFNQTFLTILTPLFPTTKRHKRDLNRTIQEQGVKCLSFLNQKRFFMCRMDFICIQFEFFFFVDL